MPVIVDRPRPSPAAGTARPGYNDRAIILEHTRLCATASSAPRRDPGFRRPPALVHDERGAGRQGIPWRREIRRSVGVSSGFRKQLFRATDRLLFPGHIKSATPATSSPTPAKSMLMRSNFRSDNSSSPRRKAIGPASRGCEVTGDPPEP